VNTVKSHQVPENQDISVPDEYHLFKEGLVPWSIMP
jgi:hypothetical protein